MTSSSDRVESITSVQRRRRWTAQRLKVGFGGKQHGLPLKKGLASYLAAWLLGPPWSAHQDGGQHEIYEAVCCCIMPFAPACVCATATGSGDTPPHAVGTAVCRSPGGHPHSAMARSGRRNDLLLLLTCIGPSLGCLGLRPVRWEHNRRDQLPGGPRRGRAAVLTLCRAW